MDHSPLLALSMQNEAIPIPPFFNDVQTLIFCDETKFYQKLGDAEDIIVYLGVAIPKEILLRLTKDFDDLIFKYRIKSPVFHATSIFRERRPQPNIIRAIADL